LQFAVAQSTAAKSNAWPEQAGPLRRAQQLRVGRTARFVRHNRGGPLIKS
jgi:hypothetical protein